MGTNKKAVGIKQIHQLEKLYETKLENGTLLKTTINLEIENFTIKDSEELLSSFATNSHNFYLHAAQAVAVLKQPKTLNLTGEARECALLGNEIVKQLFKDTSLSETIKRLDEVVNVLKIIVSKNKYSITEAIGIIPYAQSYTANIKDWEAQKESAQEGSVQEQSQKFIPRDGSGVCKDSTPCSNPMQK